MDHRPYLCELQTQAMYGLSAAFMPLRPTDAQHLDLSMVGNPNDARGDRFAQLLTVSHFACTDASIVLVWQGFGLYFSIFKPPSALVRCWPIQVFHGFRHKPVLNRPSICPSSLCLKHYCFWLYMPSHPARAIQFWCMLGKGDECKSQVYIVCLLNLPCNL